MASINEMLNWAQMSQPRRKYNPYAELAETGIEGFFGGMETGREAKRQKEKDEIERLLKTVQIMEKQAAIEREQQNMRMQHNIAVSMGFEDYTPEEKDIFRKVTNDTLGLKDVPPTAGTTTEQGKIITALESIDTLPSRKKFNIVSPKDYEVKPKITQSGYSAELVKKDKDGKAIKAVKGTAGMTPAQVRQLNKDAYALAVKMAKREGMEREGRTGTMGITGIEYEPTQDEINKWLPITKKYYLGDEKDLIDRTKQIQGLQDPYDIFK